MTLEEAQERILALEGEVAQLTTERDTLSQNNEALTADLENARSLNQRLFERVSSQEEKDVDPDDEDEEIPTCEEYAKTLSIF